MRKILGIICLFAAVGCAHLNPDYTVRIEDCADRIVSEIAKGLEGTYSGKSILVSTPVNAVTYATSDFGLVLQGFLIGSLVKENVPVIDVQLREEPHITSEGALVFLNRDAGRLRSEFKAELVIVSAYVVREQEVVITVRAIDLAEGDVVSSTTTILSMSTLVSDLLGARRQIQVFER
ncbi:MAG TPA: hypothetical protein ENN05_10465 [Deltaproteobacteria bacterium]|nr:hypothetical protein [Deltaproteobacteria bacterium]